MLVYTKTIIDDKARYPVMLFKGNEIEFGKNDKGKTSLFDTLFSKTRLSFCPGVWLFFC